ncbi:MAG: hypothetical protein IJY25_02700 [Bacilli bacterium]|nr:hypothetical protein [Bacilli bacterium]
MKNKRVIKVVTIVLIILIAFLAIFMIYQNLFASSNNTRFDGVEDHKLTNDEINSTKDVFKQIEVINDIDIFVNSKIIKIIVNLKEDVDFEQIKTISNQALGNFSEENLSFYDVEIYIESMNEESEVYPQIGYKHKSNSEFSW